MDQLLSFYMNSSPFLLSKHKIHWWFSSSFCYFFFVFLCFLQKNAFAGVYFFVQTHVIKSQATVNRQEYVLLDLYRFDVSVLGMGNVRQRKVLRKILHFHSVEGKIHVLYIFQLYRKGAELALFSYFVCLKIILFVYRLI